MRSAHLFSSLSICFALSACVSLEQLPPGSLPGTVAGQTATAASFPDIDPGGTSLTSLHFTLRGYTEYEIRPISVMAESLYNKIGNDTGLYSFLASGSYTIIIYRDRDEYLTKTHLPAWSRAVTAGSSIYLYPGADLEPVLAHEMTHLIFNNYMANKASSLRWINEGLAMYEELSKMADSDRIAFQTEQATQLRANKMTFSQMSFFTPLSEERRRVDTWYLQVTSVVSYLLTQAPTLNFGAMLNAVRHGTELDQAIANAYPGKFRSLNEIEQAWKYTV